jgi:hypothetical protein
MAESKILPTKTSDDLIESDDINKLSAQSLDKLGTEQLSNLTEETTPASTGKFLYEKPSGELRYVDTDNIPGGGGAVGITFLLKGNAYVGTKQAQILMPASATISKVIVYSDDQPTGASIIVDVNKNGTTIFTTQSGRPEVAVSTNTADSATPDVTALVQDDRVGIDIDQVGSSVVGGNDLMVTVVFA